MNERPKMRSEFWKGARRGSGWAFGLGGVAAFAKLASAGPRETFKAMIRAGLRGREVAAELSEQVQDLYEEVQSERSAEPISES